MTSQRQAFTLIELMIAVTLGIGIVYVAVAGLRVAARTVTIANRLAIENSLIRAGMTSLNEELDFWTHYDDPTLATVARPLFHGGATTGNLPFEPFTRTFPRSGTADEDATGWDPSDLTWTASSPRTWMRGNLIERQNGDLRYGRYSLFANTAAQLTANQFISMADGITGTMQVGFGPVTPPHHWYYRQVLGLKNALGYYGLLEYLPANCLYAYYSPTDMMAGGNQQFSDAQTNAGGIPKLFLCSPSLFANADGGWTTMRGKFCCTYRTSYALIDPLSPLVSGGGANALGTESRRYFETGYASNAGTQNDFATKTTVPQSLITAPPTLWPDVKSSVQHYIKNARHANICRLSWNDPLTGESKELSFAGFGTTLRGARQQRHPSGGWSRWDNDSDHISDAAYMTLDSY